LLIRFSIHLGFLDHLSKLISVKKAASLLLLSMLNAILKKAGGKIMLNFGIMGCGGISDRFCDVLNKESGVALQAVAARDKAKAAAFAEKHGAKRACTYEELVQDNNVDIIYIGTVHNRRLEQIRLCLENGKHVLCEKPMTLHEAEAQECFALAKEKNLLLVENMWPRANPCLIKAREWVRDGKIGDIKLINASFSFNFPYDPKHRLYDAETAGGAIYDAGVYPIEFAIGILNEAPESVASIFKTVATGVDGSAGIILGFANGAIATLNCALTVKTPHDAYIYGNNGSIEINKDFLRAHDAILFDNNGKEIDRVHADFEDGFCYQIRHIVELIHKGATESNLIPPADTIACAKVFDLIFK
jgi:predicted dehydrogenase